MKKVGNVRFVIVFKNYIFGLTWTSHMFYMEAHGMNHLFP